MTNQNDNKILPTRDEILQHLQQIKNPYSNDQNQSIIEAGFISAPLARMVDNQVQIGLICDTKQNDESKNQALETAIKDILTANTKAKIVQFLKPLNLKGKKHNLISNNQPMQQTGIKNMEQRPQTGHTPFGGVGGKVTSNALKNVKNIILVASGKGGVGKSTVSANLAMALAADGHKVGMLDADIYGPSLPTMFDLHEKPQINEQKQMLPLEKYGIKLMSIGFIADTNKAMIWRGPMIQGALMQMMNDCVWGTLDYLVIDLPPGTGDIQLTLAQKFNIAGAIIVSTPQILALDDVRRGIQMFTQVDVPILGIIENMAYFESADGVKNYVFGKGGAKLIAEKINVELLAEIPLIPIIGRQADMGEPLVHFAPQSDEASHYRNIAKTVNDRLAAKDNQ